MVTRTRLSGYWAAANRLKCFVCGKPVIGVIDLVMDARDVDFVSAIVWIRSRFDVPRMPVRKPTGPENERYLDGITHPIDYLVRSHIFQAAFHSSAGGCHGDRSLQRPGRAWPMHTPNCRPSVIER